MQKPICTHPRLHACVCAILASRDKYVRGANFIALASVSTYVSVSACVHEQKLYPSSWQ